jgi:hypothetical protein
MERTAKIEKVTLPKEVAFEKTKRLFNSVGTENINNEIVVTENDSLKITFRREDIKLGTEHIPRNEDELLDSHMTIKERRLLRFLDFKPEMFYILKDWKLKNKSDGSSLDIKNELEGTIIYVRKDGRDPTESAADYLENCIKVGIEPTSAAGILIMLHEIGHKKDPLLAPFGSKITQRETLDTNNPDEDRLDKERFAWAYCLKKLRNYHGGLGITSEDLDVFVHQWALGTYSAAVENHDSHASTS